MEAAFLLQPSLAAHCAETSFQSWTVPARTWHCSSCCGALCLARATRPALRRPKWSCCGDGLRERSVVLRLPGTAFPGTGHTDGASRCLKICSHHSCQSNHHKDDSLSQHRSSLCQCRHHIRNEPACSGIGMLAQKKVHRAHMLLPFHYWLPQLHWWHDHLPLLNYCFVFSLTFVARIL